MDEGKTLAVKALSADLAAVSKQITAVIEGEMFSSDKTVNVQRLSESRDRILAAIEAVSKGSGQ
jgi:hypothetical protein